MTPVRQWSAWPLIAAIVLSAIWVPSLDYGFTADDFWEVPVGWSEFLSDPLENQGRPVETLTFILVPNGAMAQHGASLLLYLLCVWRLWVVCRRLGLEQWSTLLALSALFHPAFLWNVTWIAQRSDLLVIVFVLLAIGSNSASTKLAWIAWCSGSKTPFVLQNVVFASGFLRQGTYWACMASLLLMLVFGFAGYNTYYAEAVLDENNLSGFSVSAWLELGLRLVKVAEGVLYVFAPLPMFAFAVWAPVAALLAYAGLWVVLAQGMRPFRAASQVRTFGALAVAMCLPFLFASEVRVTGPAAVLAFLTCGAAIAEWRRSAQLAVVGILALNMTGILLNYGVFRSAEYDLRAAPRPMDHSQPVYQYQAWRETVRQRLLATVGVAVPIRPFE